MYAWVVLCRKTAHKALIAVVLFFAFWTIAANLLAFLDNRAAQLFLEAEEEKDLQKLSAWGRNEIASSREKKHKKSRREEREGFAVINGDERDRADN